MLVQFVDRIPLRPGLLSPYVQQDCSGNLQCSLKVLLARTADLLEPTTGSHFDVALFVSSAVIAECGGGRPCTAPQAMCVRDKFVSR